MPAAALTNPHLSTPRRRSPRLKNIREAYDDSKNVNSCPQNMDSGVTNSSVLKHVKARVIDLDEIFASVADKRYECKDGEQDFQDISLKDIRACCKAKKRKAPEIVSEGTVIKNHTQSWNLEDVKPKEEFDLNEPLSAFKLKRQKPSPTKIKRTDVPISSPGGVKIEAATPERDETLICKQASSLEAPMHGSPIKECEKRSSANLDGSKTSINYLKEIDGKEICCAEVEDTTLAAGAPVSRGNLDILRNIKTEVIDNYSDEAVGKSSCFRSNSLKHSSAEPHQEPRRDQDNGEQPPLVSQTPAVADVSDNFRELNRVVKVDNLDGIVVQETVNIVCTLHFVEEVNCHQKPLNDLTSADMDKSSSGNEYLVCSVNQACDDIEVDEYCYPGGVQGNAPEIVKTVEESSPIDECDMDTGSLLVLNQSDLCVGTETKSASLEEVVQVQSEDQLDSLIYNGVRTKEMLLHIDIERAATDCTFDFDKTVDFVETANSVAQDGRLESIVYDALNNHVQMKTAKTNSCAGVPNTTGIQSMLVDQFLGNYPSSAKVSCDDQSLHPDDMDWSSMAKKQLNATMDGDICRSVHDQRLGKESVLWPRLSHAFVGADKADDEMSVSARQLQCSTPEEKLELPICAPTSMADSQETDGQTKTSELFIDEESIEEHAPKKLLSKRKIMSPTSQEKLCKALTDIDLCDGVQKLRRKIFPEDCNKIGRTLPLPANKQDQSLLHMDRRLKGRHSLSPTSKGILKSTESPSPHQTACSCMRSSSIHLDFEKAVEFSQRQMHDIENIAAKLIRSLRHMKSIVDEMLLSEVHSLLPNFSIAEIRAASEDALEVERTTRKWLGIMMKDCNRFCKILTLAGKKSVSHIEAPKNRRKIIFADEAGGKLCHVKVFNEEQTSLSECQID